MDTSLKYQIVGIVSVFVGLTAFCIGGIILYQAATRPSPLPRITNKVESSLPEPTPMPSTVPAIRTVEPGTYSNPDYGLTFTYPPTWQLGSDLTFDDHEIQVSYADIYFLHDAGSFEPGLLEYLANICSADGPTGSIQCGEKDTTILPFTNPLGKPGYKITRFKTIEQFIPFKKSERIEEIVFAYPMEDSDVFAIVFSPTISAITQPRDLQQIADSLH